jgi:glycosyltransferase involved in cell wall biosynthesis
VRRQTHSDWQLVIVDDASEDGTAEWLAGLTDPRISYCRLERHSERSIARNVGLDHARGNYVLFLDDDDLLLPHAIGYLVELLQTDPKAVAAVGGHEYFSERGTYRGARTWRNRFVRSPWLDALGGWCGLQGQTMYRIGILRSLGGFKSVSLEDQELWLHVGRNPVVFGRRRVVRLRCHEGQGSHRQGDLMSWQLGTKEKFVASLPVEQQTSAKRSIAYWAHGSRAQSAYISGDLNGFRRHLFGAARANPRLFVSPLMRPGILRKLTKGMLPSVMLRSLRVVRARTGHGMLIHGKP